MKRRILTVLVTCGLAASMAAPAVGAHGAQPLTSPLRFTLIQYDSPGSDDGTNASINAEWVTIHNPTSVAKAMTGFRVHDTSGHVYRFGTFRLGAGKSVRLHTGKGANTATNRYWGLSYYVWNNTGDTAFLVSNLGTTVDTCKWGDGTGSIHC